MVAGPRAAAGDDQHQGDSGGENKILVAFALLIAKPVHKEAVRAVDDQRGYDHDHANAQGGQPGEEAGHQTQRAQALGDYRQQAQRVGRVDGLGKVAYRAAIAKATKPTKQLLRAMRQDDQTQGQPQQQGKQAKGNVSPRMMCCWRWPRRQSAGCACTNWLAPLC